jgi:hypothetical protein
MKIHGRTDRDISDWRDWTRPKKTVQWKAGRSAMELARAWFTSPVPVIPPEIEALLASRPETADARLTDGWPELSTKLPERGEGRNHDLVLRGRCASGELLVAVEAKVDESLGPPIGEYSQKSKNTKGSRAFVRIDALLAMAFGHSANPNRAPWSGLQYQLLTALCGTAIEAGSRNCDVAVLIVHEFRTASAAAEKLAENSEHFADFLRALGGPAVSNEALHGPFMVAPSPSSTAAITVFVGKATYDWREAPRVP